MSSNLTNTSIIFQLDRLSRNLNLTIGFIILIGGSFGNLLNIFVFISSGNYKHNASSLYAMVRSFFDLVVLYCGLFTRILSFGFQIDATVTNQVWCKLRVAFIDVAALMSFTCLCMQSIDAFFASSRSVVYRQLSSVRIAR
ncbi:unnamed protein product [Adineta steineri]|uniref:G-protein coupled receptors family 1 profile domain-containing protein n=1 Tax=Adineta steineri TaxID=433720 RepID=A0A813NTT5_9BILA|nr:unnamed protein product [Adineta steineri]CAF3866221.1 unnamed protein product [Adineta steineri]